MLVSPLALASPEYHPITPTMESKTVTITGHDLTIEDVIAVARYGAKVQYSPDAIQHASDGRGLREEAGAEGMPVYGPQSRRRRAARSRHEG